MSMLLIKSYIAGRRLAARPGGPAEPRFSREWQSLPDRGLECAPDNAGKLNRIGAFPNDAVMANSYGHALMQNWADVDHGPLPFTKDGSQS